MQCHVIHRAGLAARPIVFLHGSGQNETTLMALAQMAASHHPAIFLRGALEWESGYAFFRRHPDRTLDMADLEQRIIEIAEFIIDQRRIGALRSSPVLVGYSNGAIMAEALIRTMPERFAGAVLLRPLSPDLAGDKKKLHGKPILLMPATDDDRRAPQDAELASELLIGLGADVEIVAHAGGHQLGDKEPERIGAWLQKHFEKIAA